MFLLEICNLDMKSSNPPEITNQNMIRKRPFCYKHYFKPKKRPITSACTVPLEPPPLSVSIPPNDHKFLCKSLIHDLVGRGLLSSAQQVLQRFIASSPTVADAVSAVEFAAANGVELGFGVAGGGIVLDVNLVNSMVICLIKLGKLDAAISVFARLNGNDDFVHCKAACNAILRGFYGQGRFLEAFDHLARVSNANVRLGMWAYNDMINGLCGQGYVSEAGEVFDIMHKRTGLPPTLHMFKTLFYAFCKRGWAVKAELIFEEMEVQGFYVDKVMYTSLMNAYCKDKKMKMAMRVYFKMLKKGCDPDTQTYNTLIHGFLQSSLSDKGWVLFKLIIDLGMQPDEITYSMMINHYCKKGKLDCAMTLLNNMVPRNLAPCVHCYTPIVAALYKQNRSLEADDLCERMLESGIVPDHILFLVLMKDKSEGLELKLSHLMLQAIAKNGCGLDHYVLSNPVEINPTMGLEQEMELLFGKIARSNLNVANVAGSIYISALCEGQKTETALAFLEKMVSVGCIPLLFTFNSLIKRLFQDGLFEDVESLLDVMQNRGIIPELETYLIMVNEYCKRGDLASAFNVLDQMEQMGPKPNVAIYDCIIGCLSRQRRICEAETLFQRMVENGVHPDEVVYMTMINAYARNGSGFKALHLFEMMIEDAIQPSCYSYTALVSGLVKRNMTLEASIYLGKMLEDGFMPNAALYTSLLSHFLRVGEFKDAFRLVDLMAGNQIEADLVMHIAWISGLCRHITGIKKRRYMANKVSLRAREVLFNLLHQRTSLPRENILSVSSNSHGDIKYLALKLMQKIKGTGFMPNLYLYNVIISGLCRAKLMQDACSQFELMQLEGLQPNEVTFTILIGAHGRAGEVNCAIGLFNRMNADGCTPDRMTYNTLLKVLAKAGRELDALSLLYAMQKRGFFPSKLAYENLLHCFCASDMSIAAFRIFEEMRACSYVPCLYRWNWLLYILCEDNKIHQACSVYDVMLERGILPDESVMRLLLEMSDKYPLLLANREILHKCRQPFSICRS